MGQNLRKEKFLLTLVAPVFNEDGNVRPFYEQICKHLQGVKWRLLFVDDGSTDDSAKRIKEVSKDDGRVGLIRLSRNYGKEVALTAGLDSAQGDVVVSLDGDLQHPLETVLEMIEKWKQGADIVIARRASASNKKILNRISSGLFYYVFNKVAATNLIAGASDFRLMDIKAVEGFRRYRESTRFLRGIVSDLGFRTETIEYEEPARESGATKFGFRKLMFLGLSGLLSFSSFPLRISTIFGFALSMFSILYGLWIVYDKFVNDIAPGMASVLVGVFFLGGVQLLSIGILGEYIAMIFIEVKKRPLYCVLEKNEIEDEAKI